MPLLAVRFVMAAGGAQRSLLGFIDGAERWIGQSARLTEKREFGSRTPKQRGRRMGREESLEIGLS